MAGFRRYERIGRPRDEVWQYFLDEGNVQRWNPGIVRMEKITDGPVGVGTRYRETRRMGDREHTFPLEITEFDEGRRYAGTVEHRGVRGTYTYTFQCKGDATHIRLEAEVTGCGVMKLFVPIVKRFMIRQDGNQLHRLKEAIEEA